MRAFMFCAAAMALVLPSMVRAQEVVLEPSSKWQLDYAEEKCRLGRTFGEGEQKTVLFLEQHEPSESFGWTVAGKPVGRFSEERMPRVIFGTLPPMQRDRERSGIFAGQLEGFGPALISAGYKDGPRDNAIREAAQPGLPQLDPADGGRIEWIEFSRGDNRRLRLNTGDMRPAFEALNRCVGNLVTHWGLDLEQQRSRVSRPEWINSDVVVRRIQAHYPGEALRNGNRARLNMRVMIGVDGKPTQCVLTHITMAANFDDRPCQEMMRLARFAPARDQNGQPVPSYYSANIIYVFS